VRAIDAPAGLAFAADGLTVAAEGFNAAWLTGHWLGTEHRGRRLAAVTLARERRGAVQAAFSHATYSDSGCELARSCLRCPLPRCQYDAPRSVGGTASRRRRWRARTASASGRCGASCVGRDVRGET
jgi:hypothetical protein